MFRICLDYVLRTLIDLMKKNGFTLAKARSGWYSTQTIMDTDYADDIALMAYTPTKAKSLLHSLEKTAGATRFHINADKTEYMRFNQNRKGDISTLKGGSLKLVDKFTYLGTSILSTKNDINARLVKPWTAIDRLSAIWRSYLSDKIQRNFSRQQLNLYYYMDAPHGHCLYILFNISCMYKLTISICVNELTLSFFLFIQCLCIIDICIYLNPPSRVQWDTRSVFLGEQLV